MSTLDVRVDGRSLDDLIGWSDLSLVDRWPYGCWEASWTVDTTGGRRSTYLTAGKKVAIYNGSAVRWSGYMVEPNWDTGEMVAFGSVRRGDGAVCLNGMVTTSTPDLAIDGAIARGAVDWIRRDTISAVPFSDPDETDGLNYLTQLLDAYTLQAGLGWGVNARNEVFLSGPPSVPKFATAPDPGSLGVSADAVAARIFARYERTDGSVGLTDIGAGSPELGVSLRPLGPIDDARAAAILAGIYNQTRGQSGWTNGLELARGEVTTLGGAVVSPVSLSAGAFGPVKLRLPDVRDQRGVSAMTDILLAETTYNATADTVQCNPVGMVARDLTSIIEGVGAELLWSATGN